MSKSSFDSVTSLGDPRANYTALFMQMRAALLNEQDCFWTLLSRVRIMAATKAEACRMAQIHSPYAVVAT